MSHAFAVQSFVADIGSARSLAKLQTVLQRATYAAGFRHFALIEHEGSPAQKSGTLRLHNYPPSWASFHDHRIGPHDPIWAISERCSFPFTWAEARAKGDITSAGEAILDQARDHGVFGGVTIPGNIARHRSASVSFATPIHGAHPALLLPALQFLSTASLDAARQLRRIRSTASAAHLTVRQKECVLWVARGKGDWEIAQILGISRLTVTEHLKKAQQAFDVSRRTALLSETIRSGHISVDEI